MDNSWFYMMVKGSLELTLMLKLYKRGKGELLLMLSLDCKEIMGFSYKL